MSEALGPIGVRAFEGRGISPETAARYAVYTARQSGDGVLPDERGNIIVFPFIERGVVVNEKFRAPGKRFWQRTGGRKTFYNVDVLDEAVLSQQGGPALVITEGELDCLTAIDCGFPHSVSVPDGAPAVTENENPDELKPIDPGQENAGKFEFMWNNRDRLKRVKRFVLAVDNDRPGQRLAAELSRRLSPSRCLFVTYPEGCKDLNDVRRQYGPEAVARVLNGAQPYPVRGLYRLSEYPEVERIETFSTGWSILDQHLLLFPGEFVVVTGIPSHGKSTFALNLLVNLSRQYGWCSAIFSPEMPTVPHLRDKLRRIYMGRDIPLGDTASLDELEQVAEADRWLEWHFSFIDTDPSRDSDEDCHLDWVLDRATDAVMRDGIKVLLIDPWNEVEHARKRDELLTDYVGRSIRALKRFAQQYGVIVIVIAHPTKEIAERGKTRSPTLYDIEGSAHWCNKADHGVIIEWPDLFVPRSIIRISKVRFEETGQRGQVTLGFDKRSGRYSLLNESIGAIAS